MVSTMVNSNKKNLKILFNSGVVLNIPKIDIDSITFPKTKIGNRHISKKIKLNSSDKNQKRRW